MNKLFQDLEAATEGSRDLSDRVLLACGWAKPDYGKLFYWKAPSGQVSIEAPDPTRSIDDAVALVPEGWKLANAQQLFLGGSFGVTIHGKPFNQPSTPMAGGLGKTFPLAICIAVLKALTREEPRL